MKSFKKLGAAAIVISSVSLCGCKSSSFMEWSVKDQTVMQAEEYIDDRGRPHRKFSRRQSPEVKSRTTNTNVNAQRTSSSRDY